MARLDDDQLNIRPEVAAALRYHAGRANAAPSRRNARAAAQPRRAHDRGDGFSAGLFGAFGVALVLLLIICAVSGAVSRAGSAVTTGSHPQTGVQPREPQGAAVSEPDPQPQAPPAIETTNLEIDSQQTMQPPPQSESMPSGIEAPTASDPSSARSEKPEITVGEAIQGEPVVVSQPRESEQRERRVELPRMRWHGAGGASAPPFSNWRWVCMSRDGLRCALQDVNGRQVQSFFWNGGSVRASDISTEALFPQGLAWGCAKMPGLLYCSVLDRRGTSRQGCSYDGRSLACGN